MWGAGGRGGGGQKSMHIFFGFAHICLQKYAIFYAIFARILAVGRVSLFIFNRGRGHTTKKSMAYILHFGHIFWSPQKQSMAYFFVSGHISWSPLTSDQTCRSPSITDRTVGRSCYQTSLSIHQESYKLYGVNMGFLGHCICVFCVHVCLCFSLI